MNVRCGINCALTNAPTQRNVQHSDFMPKTLHTVNLSSFAIYGEM